MPDTPTTRLGLYKSASDGSEDVSYTQDIGQNLDKLDAAVGFQIVTSSTRPSSPYPGKAIAESDTSYRSYFSNGTAPASASWVEIPNSSGTYGGNLALASGSSITLGGDTNLRRDAAGAVATEGLFRSYRSSAGSNSFSARVTGDTASRWFVNADGAMAWGPGGAASTDVALARSAAGRLAITGTSAGLVIGSATYQNALTAAGTTVANTTTETVVGTFTIPAGDAVVGATYRARMIANVSFLASAQLTWRARLGGVAGTALGALGPTTLSGTGQTNKESVVQTDLVCVSTGASGTWFAMLQETRNTQDTGSVGGASGSVGGGVQLVSTDGTVTRDTTASNAFVITAQWAAASASNTLTARCVMERVA
ncbi:MAG: hypothetical protein HOV94_22710 [Saccharothrix sp.]|nr:hypothetical protein [Saccharothrix sp.]